MSDLERLPESEDKFADAQKKAKGAGKTVTAYTQGIAKAEKAQKMEDLKARLKNLREEEI